MDSFFQKKLKNYEEIEFFLLEILCRSLQKVKDEVRGKEQKKKRNNRIGKKTEHLENESMEKAQIDKAGVQKLLKKLKKEKEKRLELIRKERESFQKKVAKEIEEEKIKENTLKVQKHEEHLQRIKEMHENNYRQKSERIEEFEKAKVELKRVASVKPLFKEIADRYTVAVEIPELEHRKQELAKKRQLIAPINVKALDSHQQTYNKLLEDLHQKRKKKMADVKRESQINASLTNLYKSKIFEIVKQTEKQQLEIEMEKIENRKKLVEKSKKYGELVTELYQPIVKVQKNFEISKKNLNKSENKIKAPDLAKVSVHTSRTRTTKCPNQRIKRKLSTNVEEKHAVFDYLASQRKFRSENPNKKSQNLQEIIEDTSLTPKRKIKKLQKEVKKLDFQTKSYEILDGVANTLSLSQNLNESYISTIKAKLVYLNELINT